MIRTLLALFICAATQVTFAQPTPANADALKNQVATARTQLPTKGDRTKVENVHDALALCIRQITEVARNANSAAEKATEAAEKADETAKKVIARQDALAKAGASLDERVADFEKEVRAALNAVPNSDHVVDETVARVRRALFAEMSEQVDTKLLVIDRDIDRLKARFEKHELGIVELQTRLAGMAVEARHAVESVSVKSVIDPETYRFPTRIVPAKAKGTRGKQTMGRAQLFEYVDGKERPLKDKIIRVSWTSHENGEEREIGQFATDRDGNAMFEFQLPRKGEVQKMFLFYRFDGDESHRATTKGPDRVGISA